MRRALDSGTIRRDTGAWCITVFVPYSSSLAKMLAVNFGRFGVWLPSAGSRFCRSGERQLNNQGTFLNGPSQSRRTRLISYRT